MSAAKVKNVPPPAIALTNPANDPAAISIAVLIKDGITPTSAICTLDIFGLPAGRGFVLSGHICRIEDASA